MVSEREIIISFLFKRSGKKSLKFSDIYLALSMDLNWFTPDDAKTFVNNALKEDFLKKKDSLIKPNFDYEKTIVPIGYTPSKQIFEIKEEKKIDENVDNLLDKIISLIIENVNIDKSKLSELINNLANEKNITEEVAALLIGKKYNINLNNFYEKIEEQIFKNG
ncbi:hypothetical protein AYK20_00155 [Thermoplasmatales archaeon SG8-52-1]|nr:MAG: hypothetical protein AYK20_00155 [Thermoplasmatales archaeon SG8-52-1]